MKNVFITENNIISPLGFTSETNILQIAQEKSGITLHDNMGFSPYYASIIDDEIFNDSFNKIGDIDAYTKLEKMMILSLQDTISQADFSITDRTALLIATTKGNIDALDTNTTKFTPGPYKTWKTMKR